MVFMSMETFEAMCHKERIYRELEISERQISEGRVRGAEESRSVVRARDG